ncbi:MAG: hypothetical protein I3273_05360 [Candidatus Moeniiplasma glomeromycotorum]|nr:hypothetical protein [Candidatus Moeniiplasma glomeromycotorum]MCE8167990.1 hypothetical protein [Candidatus Moeniiplasma glomeromycotorum]MCE8169517.1 hypothetical protein [Candidatus Moeniiplasma glomeromycotorum]
MRKPEVKKLLLHTIIFCSLIFLTLFVFGLFTKWERTIWNTLPPLIITAGIIILYSRFMLKWFRKMKQAKKPGNWDYLIFRWTDFLWLGIALIPLAVVGGLVSHFTS